MPSRHPALTTRPSTGALALTTATLLAACGGDSPKHDYEAEISRTSYGIPHVSAVDEGSLGYGVGYVQAQDGVCVLAEQFATVAGERSRYLGEGAAGGATGVPANLASDYFFRLLNEEASVQTAWRAQSKEARELMRGWVAGYNRHVRETAKAKLPQDCRDAPWVREIVDVDLVRLTRFYNSLNGILDFQAQVVAAQPGQATAASALGTLLARTAAQRRPTASNALALGRDGSQNGRGLLLGNPHFPWAGVLRMMQLHTTIPGKLDVMGATLPGLPVVGIGFTSNFAWSHTTTTSAHSTLYRLALDPADPTRYMVDGASKAMERQRIDVPVKQADGTVQTRSRTFYRSEFGWLIGWDAAGATAMRDARLDNHRLVDEWYGINRAASLDQVKTVVRNNVGNPWNNTIAADKEGRTLFMAVSPVPKLSTERARRCIASGFEAPAANGIFVLDARADCRWEVDPTAPQSGIFSGKDLPILERNDFVHNANDSAWMANPAAPLTGYSPLVSMDGVELDARARFGLRHVTQALSGGARMSAQDVQAMLMNNRVYLADLVLDDVLRACVADASLATPCTALSTWDRSANLEAGVGYGYFDAFVPADAPLPADFWRVPFDPGQPLSTPRGLRVEDPAVAAAVRDTLRGAAASVDDSRLWRDGKRWGDVQRASRGTGSIPVHGGSARLGVYNAMESGSSFRWREVVAGTSYVQVVGFNADGPVADALLAYSQSPHSDSPHAADQTLKFSAKEWIRQPFTRAQIDSDPQLRRVRITE
ncbi:penicillin acylase family protein [Roseateles aquatilis]|nr:penicillin acylase family protein [Roseateles aquatilis]